MADGAAIAGRPHSTALALVAALAIPGGGQAYNGRPIKGVFFLLSSVLVLPWLWSVLDAAFEARRIRASGGRFGKGGCLWIILQAWLAFDLLLAILIALSVAGVFS